MRDVVTLQCVHYETLLDLVQYMYYGTLRPIHFDFHKCMQMLEASYELELAAIRKPLIERIAFLVHNGE